MNIIKKSVSPLVLAISLISTPAHTALHIVTDSDRTVLSRVGMGKDIVPHVTVSAVDRPSSDVAATFTDMPLLVVLSQIVPTEYELLIDESIEGLLVSWSGSKPWSKILDDLSKKYSLLSSTPSLELIVSVSPDDALGPVLSNDVGIQASGDLIKCFSKLCDEGLVDIEKLVLDTSWVALDVEHTQSDLVFEDTGITQDVVANAEAAVEAELLAQESKRVEDITRDYLLSPIHPGDGSFESFANNGGTPGKDSLNPEDKHTYVYRAGTLFSTINAWADANGYTVRNDVYNHHNKDYANYSDININGSFYNATRALLNKYSAAEVPVNHKFYEKGRVLHIFVGKYK